MTRGATGTDERIVVPGRTLRHRRPRRRARRTLLALLIVAIGLIAVGGLSWFPARAAGDHLEAGRAALMQGRDLLAAGDALAARRAFSVAAREFRDADRETRNPLIRFGGLVPLAGRSYDAIGTLAGIGGRTATAGEGLAVALTELPGGLGSLAPSGGRIPVEAMRSLVPAVSAARAELEAAGEESLTLPTSYLIGPIASAADLARDEVGAALRTVRSAEALLVALPSFAGADGTRRYFVAAQSPAELRGTGGFIGSFAILTATDGRLELGPFREISVLRNVAPANAPAPSSDFREVYDRFGGAGFWRNLNMTPDAPTAATMIEALYERVRGIPLDGTIFVNPQALAELLEATGPVRSPLLDRTLTAEDVVDYLANGAYEEFGYRASLRKRVLGIVAGGVVERFLRGADRDADPQADLRSVVDAASAGHLLLHAADPDVQAAFETAGIAGKLGTPRGDFLGVFTSDASGTKVDYYMSRDVRYEVSLGAGGTGSAEASLTFRNDAPADARPSYVLGPYSGTGLGVGDHQSFLSVYCRAGCEMARATEEGDPAGMEVHTELGFRSLSRYVRVDAQGSRTIGLSLRLRRIWAGDELGGTYTLRIQGQPTIRPTTVTLVVRVPDGMRIVHTSVPMQVRGAEATWRGSIGRQRDFSVRFQRPFPGRVWTQIWGFLT
ncbi:MAG TPA: DUF4012 domain-containing protein [Actinomycetota bacterium]|nr:DUF4012 domain-containing protein [Actinomycetota bacterium]